MSELVKIHLLIREILRGKNFRFNTHDIALKSVRFGEKSKVVFSYFKTCHLVQNGRFTHQQ